MEERENLMMMGGTNEEMLAELNRRHPKVMPIVEQTAKDMGVDLEQYEWCQADDSGVFIDVCYVSKANENVCFEVSLNAETLELEEVSLSMD